VVGVVGVGDGELSQLSEVRIDRLCPRGVGRGQAQLDPVLPRPAADIDALVGGRIVKNHVDWCAVVPGSADRLQRGQRVRGTFLAAVDAHRRS